MAYPPEWVSEGVLAKSSRPGHPSKTGISQSIVDSWIAEAKDMGIKSIICFLSDDQLPFYSELPNGLLSYYEEAGFEVAHIPQTDYTNPPLSDENIRRAISRFDELEKPVLIHCSAGISRTRMAVRKILELRLSDV